MRTAIVSATALLGVFVFASSPPAVAGHFYIGGSVGESEAGLRIPDIADDGSTITGTVDDSDTAWKIFGGYRFFKLLAVEGAWMDLGEATIDATSDGTGTTFAAGPVKAAVSADGFALSAVGVLPVGPNLRVFGKVGLLAWDARATLNNAAVGTLSDKDDGTDPLLGAGFQYDFAGPLSLRLEWEKTEVEDNDVDLVSLGLTFRF